MWGLGLLTSAMFKDQLYSVLREKNLSTNNSISSKSIFHKLSKIKTLSNKQRICVVVDFLYRNSKENSSGRKEVVSNVEFSGGNDC